MQISLITGENPKELKQALTLVRDVFWDLVAPDYADEGIWTFDSFIEQENITAELAGDRLLMWGYFTKDGRLIGVLAARPPCHICLFFVDKRAHRKGVGRMLFETMLDYFQRRSTCEEITVHSSPFAVDVYRHLGFTPTGEETTEDGITYTPMARPLRDPAPETPTPETEETAQ